MKKTNKFMLATALTLGLAPLVVATATEVGHAKVVRADGTFAVTFDMGEVQDDVVISGVSADTLLYNVVYYATPYMTVETDDLYLYSFVDRPISSFVNQEELLAYAEEYREGIMRGVTRVQEATTYYAVWLEYDAPFRLQKPRNFKLNYSGTTAVPGFALCDANFYLINGKYRYYNINIEFSRLENAADPSDYSELDIYGVSIDYSYCTVGGHDVYLIDVDNEGCNNKKYYDAGGYNYNYVYIDSAGTEEELDAVGATNLNGKIVAVNRGGITFAEKIANAEARGAAGFICFNNQDGVINMNISPYTGGNPVASALKADAQYFRDNGEEHTLASGTKYYTGSMFVSPNKKAYKYPFEKIEYLSCEDAASTAIGGKGDYIIGGYTVVMPDPTVIDDSQVYYSDMKVTIEGVDYTGEVQDTKEFYATAYLCQGTKYSLYFDPNGGTGEQDNDWCLIDEGGLTALPECTFTAPVGKVFDYWEIAGAEYHPGDDLVMDHDYEIKAIWKDAPKPKPAKKKGCGGSIEATSAILSILSLAGVGLIIFKKKKVSE